MSQKNKNHETDWGINDSRKKSRDWSLRKKESHISRGRTTIDDNRRTTSYSKRADEGTLVVEKMKTHCPNCGHYKVFRKPRGTFCTRCRFKRK